MEEFAKLDGERDFNDTDPAFRDHTIPTRFIPSDTLRAVKAKDATHIDGVVIRRQPQRQYPLTPPPRSRQLGKLLGIDTTDIEGRLGIGSTEIYAMLPIHKLELGYLLDNGYLGKTLVNRRWRIDQHSFRWYLAQHVRRENGKLICEPFDEVKIPYVMTEAESMRIGK